MNQTRNSITDIWGPRAPYLGDWPVRVDIRTTDEPTHWVRGACVLCSAGCGLDIAVKDNCIVGVRGVSNDPVNRGRLGPKGLHSWEANASADRLTTPLIRRNGQLEEASWDEAMDLLVQRSKAIIAEHTSLAMGFYTTGQLYLEEYYTLSLIGKAGLSTPHMDGNTRLCTATSAAALKQSFGSDGQPGSLSDIDVAEAILLVGHNMASQQTVPWMRVLDRLDGPKPPKLVVIDPRETETAKRADVHLALRIGTNVPVLNGILNLIILAGQINPEYIQAHTVGYEELVTMVSKWTPEKVEEISGVPADKLRAAADILGRTDTLISTALQGVYQSMQATAAAVQINNLHLIRGLIGRPGCSVFQMNGQPTSQNTRETGADGDMPGFRNPGNPAHMAQLAKLWNVDINAIPYWSPPTHAMQIWRYAEQGSIKLMWISGTNPAVSMPELSRIRQILEKEDLFVVVQDAFMTETAQRADLVLPVAIWGEKTGCMTNADRTVHINHKAIDPPGQAKSDFDIFLDYAQRMDFRDKDGAPLIKWTTPEEAFAAWKECSRGRPCDYTGMTYEKLSQGPVQWPCNEQFPNGASHLYTDGVFSTDADYCEAFGQDMSTGGADAPEEYRANNPAGKAFIRPTDYEPPQELPDADYPFWLTTGRLVYQFHTRTKTGRSKELNEAAPDSFVQLAAEDAANYGIAEGDIIEVESRRGRVVQPARIGHIRSGTVFIPFHYGYWDSPGRSRAVNELTPTQWDPVSKQPYLKFSAVRIRKVARRAS